MHLISNLLVYPSLKFVFAIIDEVSYDPEALTLSPLIGTPGESSNEHSNEHPAIWLLVKKSLNLNVFKVPYLSKSIEVLRFENLGIKLLLQSSLFC